MSLKLLDMKKIIGLFIFMGLLSATTVQAQNYNTKCLGISAGYMFDTENVQAGVFMHLPFAKNWRVVPSVNYTFSHHDLNEWEINGNIHYLIPFAGRFSVYPLNLHIEGKYIFINDFNQANISIGLGYKF